MVAENWWIDGDGEVLFGDLNDPHTSAGKILIAAALIHMAGYAGFTLEECLPLPEHFGAIRETHQAIEKARVASAPRPWWRFWR